MLPSIRTLENAFPGKGKELRRVLEMRRKELAEHPAGAARIAACWHPPKTYDVRLHVLNAVAETFGVEYIAHADDGYREGEQYGIDYINTGDTYTPTIVRFAATGTYQVRSWGDIVERNPKLG